MVVSRGGLVDDRDSPQTGERVAVDGLRERPGAGADAATNVRPSAFGGVVGGGPRLVVSRHVVASTGSEGGGGVVIEEEVGGGRIGEGRRVTGAGEGGLEVGALGVLALALVGVLMAAEGLGGGEVAATVVALELPAALLPAGRPGAGADILGVLVLVLGTAVGGAGGFLLVELHTKEADVPLPCWCRSNKRELGEGVYVHVVLSSILLGLLHVCMVELEQHAG